MKATVPSGKYIPPQLRGAMDSKRKAELEKLKKSVKGLVNRYAKEARVTLSKLEFSTLSVSAQRIALQYLA